MNRRFATLPQERVATSELLMRRPADGNHYQTAVAMGLQLAEYGDKHRAACDVKAPQIVLAATQQMDAYIAFLLTHFKGPVTRATLADIIARDASIDVMTVERLRAIENGAVPFALVRQLIKRHGVPMQHKNMQHWAAFTARYIDTMYRTPLAA